MSRELGWCEGLASACGTRRAVARVRVEYRWRRLPPAVCEADALVCAQCLRGLLTPDFAGGGRRRVTVLERSGGDASPKGAPG